SFRGPQHWSYLSGEWAENEEGLIKPPAVAAADRLAFYVGQMYSEVEAEFEFRWNTNHCGAGFVVRAQDPSHYYLVHFPLCGQQYRAKHFWAAISKADGSGWLDILKLEMIQGVPSEMGIGKGLGVSPWHKARVVVKGNEIRVWVDGRPGPVVYDDAYKSGYVGLESWGYSGPGGTFRNVKIRGQEVPPQPWNEANQPPQNWFNPYPKGGGQQAPSGMAGARDGSLLLNISGTLLRSTDRGRNWEPMEAEGWNGGRLVSTKEGRVLAFGRQDKETTLSFSDDNGQTWSAPEKVVQAPFKPDIPNNPDRPMALHPMQGFMELQDGTLLAFQVATDPSWKIGESIYEWGGLHYTGWSTRSTDGGYTWSAAVPLDGPPAVGMCFDLVEFSSNIQTRDGNVLCLSRPVYSPWMWESWSENNGESWGPAMRGPFPGYACATPPHATASGALVVGSRMPGLAVHVSHDDGITWKHYRIDTVIWAMGAMYEVASDVLLWVYYGEYSPNPDARAQFIRVTPDGLEPASEMLPIE
ncbi:MAG: exo-alpha-sialidase, partial [candidate division Zixibacteria bacterium]|nr:exo-alpha-sialidase [candidate division Zixibacteria bacterium]